MKIKVMLENFNSKAGYRLESNSIFSHSASSNTGNAWMLQAGQQATLFEKLKPYLGLLDGYLTSVQDPAFVSPLSD